MTESKKDFSKKSLIKILQEAEGLLAEIFYDEKTLTDLELQKKLTAIQGKVGLVSLNISHTTD